MKIHPLADLFPSMDEDAFQRLKEDINLNGIIEPIWLHNQQIIDGRHRHRAATELAIPCPSRDYTGNDPLGFVISLNLKRRHLNESQRALIAAKIANMKQGRPENSSIELITPVSQAKAAEMMNVGVATLKRAKAILEADDSEAVRQIERGELTVSKAIAETKKAVRREDLKQQAAAIPTLQQPTGLYDVIVMDPPWNYGREYDPDSSRVANPYPEMTQQQLLALKPPAKGDSVLFLWTTHQFIFDAKALLDHWSYTYKATLVWNKEKMGMGAWLRMQCEFCLVAIKGKPFWDNKTHRDIISEPRREHSRKPDAFYAFVDSVTEGRKLDFFSREQRKGWDTFGNDTQKF